MKPDEVGTRVRAQLERHPGLSASLKSRPRFLERAEKFSSSMALWGSRANLTAKPDNPSELAFHILDSLAPLTVEQPLIGDSDKVIDIGAGAGFPSLILASACAAHFTLIESRQKRASFLKVASAEMGLENVAVEARRLEPGSVSRVFDVALGRAFGPAPEFYDLAAAALKPGGLAILYANPSQRLVLDSAKASGLDNYRRETYSVMRDGSKTSRVLALWTRV